MYIVYRESGDIFNALDGNVNKEENYFCPLCKSKVIFKKGIKINSHFAHVKNSNCKLNTYKKESKEHLQVKEQLYKHLKNKYEKVKLEHIFKTRDSLQIADVYLENLNIAIEYQRSVIPFSELKNRTLGYENAGIKLIWLIDTNKFVKELKVQNNIVHIRYAPFVDNFLNYHKGCVFFYGYDRECQNIIFYQLWAHNLKRRNAICKKIVVPLNKLSFPLNFKFFKEDNVTTIYKSDVENYIYKQLKFDKTVKNKLLSILYNQRIALNNIPKEIGFNINEQLLIRTPLLIWQAEYYRLFNDNKTYNEIASYMLNYLELKNSIYISAKDKNQILMNVINSYYKLLLLNKE